MNYHLAVAHSIHKHLDIVEAYPEVLDMKFEELEGKIDAFIRSIQDQLTRSVVMFCEQKSLDDAVELTVHCLRNGVNLPQDMMLKMAQEIIHWAKMDYRRVGENRWLCTITL